MRLPEKAGKIDKGDVGGAQFSSFPRLFSTRILCAMSTLPTGRNDLCPCGSGKKFKRCCYLRWRYQDATVDNSEAIQRKVRWLVEECVILRDFVDSAAWLFGYSSRPNWWTEFEDFRQKLAKQGGAKQVAKAREW